MGAGSPYIEINKFKIFTAFGFGITKWKFCMFSKTSNFTIDTIIFINIKQEYLNFIRRMSHSLVSYFI
jgi:hypothetical protein